MARFQKSESKRNRKTRIKRKYSCYVYGEGRKDKNFLQALIDLKKFKYHTSKWFFNYGNASGGSAKIILEKCKKAISKYDYDLVLCFIDIDNLKSSFPKTWKKEKQKLEKYYSKIEVIWQIDKLEDEFKKVLGDKYKGKHRLNKVAKEKIKDFINSSYWKRILKPIKEKEKKLQK